MIKVFTAQQMRDFDQTAVEEYAIPSIVLMENAALCVVEFLEMKFAPFPGKRAVIFCGTGNNGGDGFAIARHLEARGCHCKVVLSGSADDIKGDALTNFEILKRTYQLRRSDEELRASLSYEELIERPSANVHLDTQFDFAVDALLGTGFKGEVREGKLKTDLLRMQDGLFNLLKNTRVPIVSVDIPSGLDADSGTGKDAARADYTVSFVGPKRGMLLRDGLEKCGEVWIGDIGTPQQQLEQTETRCEIITRRKAKELLPHRTVSAHKGDAGRVAICGGSFGMSGAPTLAARAALAAGAGLCSALLPSRVLAIFAAGCLEATSHALSDDENGSLLEEAAPRALQLSENADALAIGPGISRGEGALNCVRRVLLGLKNAAIVDADGLYALRAIEGEIQKREAPLILTPHPGEMGELLSASTRDVENDRFAAVTECARRYNAIVVLKGARTLVATPDGNVFINITGNAGMATGGSGDTLTGIIAGLLAQTRDALSATLLGVHIHGAAGDRAYATRGYGLIAGDIAENIAPALHNLNNEVTEEGSARLRLLR
jgi:hydroxyethylthiazole kinase-like uncharacterized protein yjeF